MILDSPLVVKNENSLCGLGENPSAQPRPSRGDTRYGRYKVRQYSV